MNWPSLVTRCKQICDPQQDEMIFNSQDARWFMGTQPGSEIDAMKGFRGQSACDQKIEG